MYQLEVKKHLIQHHFPPDEGWDVTIDIDAMERARGGIHPPDKKARAEAAEAWLVEKAVAIGAHPEYGRVDLVACKADSPTYLVEVEGDSSLQREQAMYSALGQTILLMTGEDNVRYALAVPDSPEWEMQMRKIPEHIKAVLGLDLWLVGEDKVRAI